MAIYFQKHPRAAKGVVRGGGWGGGGGICMPVHFQQVLRLMARRGDWRDDNLIYRRLVQQGWQQWEEPNFQFLHGCSAASNKKLVRILQARPYI